MWELWPADAQGAGELRVYWFDSRRQYASAQLDAASGMPLAGSETAPQRQTLGGQHFVDFHYQLHAGPIGLWIVGIAALAMLAALVSGVITHRRIFQDFFTFRTGRGQRSWLDAHNAVAVLTLPFQFMIAYIGIVISGATFLPAAVVAQFGAGSAGRIAFHSALEAPGKPEPSGRAMAVPDLEPFVLRGQQLMGQPVRAVVIDHPGDAAARIGIYGWNEGEAAQRRLSPTSGMALFSAASGELLQLRQPGGVDGGKAALAQSVLGGLHMAKFGGFALKWLYILCGLAGSAMMATGAILFIVKRRQRHLGEFGAATARVYRLIEAANVAAIAGLGLGCIGYLWANRLVANRLVANRLVANRLVPLGLAHRDDWGLAVFFGLWALALVHALARPRRRGRSSWACWARCACCCRCSMPSPWATICPHSCCAATGKAPGWNRLRWPRAWPRCGRGAWSRGARHRPSPHGAWRGRPMWRCGHESRVCFAAGAGFVFCRHGRAGLCQGAPLRTAHGHARAAAGAGRATALPRLCADAVRGAALRLGLGQRRGLRGLAGLSFGGCAGQRRRHQRRAAPGGARGLCIGAGGDDRAGMGRAALNAPASTLFSFGMTQMGGLPCCRAGMLDACCGRNS